MGRAARTPGRGTRQGPRQEGNRMDTAELDRESAELLPDRQALGCWKWSPCGHDSSWSWGWSWHSQGWQSHCPPPKCW